MKMLDRLIDNLNFKKAALTYIIISMLLLVLCLSAVAYMSRDKIYLAIDYKSVSVTFEKSGITDGLKAQLKKLAADSKDINNVIILDRENNINYQVNNSLTGNKPKLQLIPYEARQGYLQDSTSLDNIYKIVGPENIILNEKYIQNNKKLRQDIDGELSYELDFTSKKVYLLNYMVDGNTGNKILVIRTVNPIPYAERLVEITGSLLWLIFTIYWLGLALWVYKDANRRKLNAALWGLLILITNLVGLFVYIVNKQNNQTCYKCGTLQNRTNIFCYNCGTKINDSCKSCGAIINKREHYCSRCGSEIVNLNENQL